MSKYDDYDTSTEGKRILGMVAKGKTRKEIAEALNISKGFLNIKLNKLPIPKRKMIPRYGVKEKNLTKLQARQLRKYLALRSSCTRNGGVKNFDLEFEDLHFPKVCPVLGMKLNYFETDFRKGNCPSFDQIRPGEGYVKGNVRVISLRANRIKYDASEKELRRVLRYIKDPTLERYY